MRCSCRTAARFSSGHPKASSYGSSCCPTGKAARLDRRVLPGRATFEGKTLDDAQLTSFDKTGLTARGTEDYDAKAQYAAWRAAKIKARAVVSALDEVDLAEQAARREPLRVEPYRALFDLHMKRREWDAAWCAAAVLARLEDATDAERVHYERFARREATPVDAPLDDARVYEAPQPQRFDTDPPTVDVHRLHAAAKSVMVERSSGGIEKSADRAAFVVSGSFAPFDNLKDAETSRASREALFPFAASLSTSAVTSVATSTRGVRAPSRRCASMRRCMAARRAEVLLANAISSSSRDRTFIR